MSICRACRAGNHDKCWKEWANMNMDDLSMGPTQRCECDHQEDE